MIIWRSAEDLKSANPTLFVQDNMTYDPSCGSTQDEVSLRFFLSFEFSHVWKRRATKN
jgi:hypothetical protein